MKLSYDSWECELHFMEVILSETKDLKIKLTEILRRNLSSSAAKELRMTNY